jgi:uncharacterized repeat protein (TIGR03803 family)
MRPLVLAFWVFLCANQAIAIPPKTLYNLPGGGDGVLPIAGLVSVNQILYGTTLYGGAHGRGGVFSISPAGTEKIIYSFTGRKDGQFPLGTLISVNGLLYGTTEEGGVNGFGTVFALDPATGAKTTVYNFASAAGINPSTALLQAGPNLYGTTPAGGAQNDGTIFSIDVNSGQETTSHSFSGADGKRSEAGLVDVAGILYGTTAEGGSDGLGTVFSFDPANGALSTLVSFADNGAQGEYPQGSLLNLNGILYGTTVQGGQYNRGIVFAFNLGNSTLATVHSFGNGSDGSTPFAGLANAGNLLYGTTFGGFGTLFSLDIGTGAENVVYNFTGGLDGQQPQSAPIVVGDTLFATSGVGNNPTVDNGAVVAINLNTGAEANLHTFVGSYPYARSTSDLIKVGNIFYGTTEVGGASHSGSIFSVNATTGAGATLYSFSGGNDGGSPSGALIQVGDLLYGATSQGGVSNHGTLFGFNPATNSETVVYSLAGFAEGSSPNAPLLNINQILYGTTEDGGSSGTGTIFKFDLASGVFTQLYFFLGPDDAAFPVSGLIAVDNMLYGTSYSGGLYEFYGSVFSYNLSTNQENLVFSFPDYTYGAGPGGSPHYLGGNLYLTTQYGGHQTCQCGRLFRINPTTGNATVLYTFDGADDGSTPTAALVNIGAVLYGSTSAGGPKNGGTIFTFDTSNDTFETAYGFRNGRDGGTPKSRLFISGPNLYGTTSTGGTKNAGTVFSLTP